MPSVGQNIMQKIYGNDIWRGLEPSEVTPDLQGWNGNHPSLDRLAGEFTYADVIVVDVGVWKGQSTITMANAMRRAGINGCVIAVDTFLGSAEHWSGAGELFSRKNGLPDLYYNLLKQCICRRFDRVRRTFTADL